jgi:uncharacterized membrane protein HdeD (DUF308 family)
MAMPAQTTQPGWVYAALGIVSILFGILAITWPGLTIAVLVIFVGVWFLVSGVISLIDMVRRMGQHETWWPSLLIGVISIIAGLFVVTYPSVSAVVLLWVIAFWAIFTGIVEIIGAFSTGQFLMIIVGVLTIIFGFILLANPGVGALALIFVIGIFAIVRGIVQLLHAFNPPTTPAVPA